MKSSGCFIDRCSRKWRVPSGAKARSRWLLTDGLKPVPFNAAEQAAEKLFSEGVILSVAKDLLFVSVESNADPSVAQNRRDLGMTLARVFQ
jgi:hypothetical protein